MKKLVLAIILLLLLLAVGSVHASGYQEMPVIWEATCWSCHDEYVPVLQSQWSTNPIVRGEHPVQSPCLGCHNMNVQQSPRYRYCTVCHYPGGSLGINNYFSWRHTTDGRQGFLNLPNVRHDMAAAHESGDEICLGCHAGTLTSEHYRENRTDRYGDPVTCDTCHTGSGLADRLETDGTLRIEKDRNYQLEWSDSYYAPAGEGINRVRITHALNRGNSMEVHALYNGKWGIVYYRTSGVVDTWFDLPYPATAIRARMHAPYSAPEDMWGVDVPEVELAATPTNTPRYASVLEAVTEKDTSCGSCHDLSNIEGHPEHSVSLNSSCASCHGTSMSEEEVRHQNDCGSCHNSDNALVREAIRVNRTDCFSCHTSAHGVRTVSAPPGDIPLDARYNWSIPESVSIWQQEEWFPEGMLGAAGLVVYSNRLPLVEEDVFYDVAAALAEKGWQLGEQTEEAGFVFGNFEKKGRVCLVWCGDFPGTGSGAEGIRVFIAYE
ncbi:cytochrome c3 family protein [Dethiobacter alkaliphilus]|uniref:cytochrome c3 family protein n=1 Tax=Dethiobacter alkaliphilus TaxID=427926 RepID=UPI002226981D|nr:cytochrome c3 family protein [Dethiobacter alkaliphilus]MCW3489291.1 cytochrome c3 family protein [Dethiobacter alkaliphilus]